jgi:hypothetical protein
MSARLGLLILLFMSDYICLACLDMCIFLHPLHIFRCDPILLLALSVSYVLTCNFNTIALVFILFQVGFLSPHYSFVFLS